MMNDDSMIEHLVQVPNGMPRHTKSFNLDDLCIQMYRLLQLIFIVDIRKLLYMLFANSLFVFFAGFATNSDMVLPNGCRPHDPDGYNRTCQDELEDGILTGTYIVYQQVLFILISASAIGFSAVFLVELLKVFINEHRNGKKM